MANAVEKERRAWCKRAEGKAMAGGVDHRKQLGLDSESRGNPLQGFRWGAGEWGCGSEIRFGV